MPYWRLHYHLVWATKRREPLIDVETRRTIERSLQLSIDDMGITSHAVGIMPEHVHVALSVPPRHSIAEVMKRLKGAWSHAVRTTNASFTWQAEFGALSFGDRALPDVREYVLDQATHHANGTTIARLECVGQEPPGNELPG
jgi:putative transposase